MGCTGAGDVFSVPPGTQRQVRVRWDRLTSYVALLVTSPMILVLVNQDSSGGDRTPHTVLFFLRFCLCKSLRTGREEQEPR